MKLFYDPETGQPTHTLDTEDPDILARQAGAFIEIESLPADLSSLRVVDGQVVADLAAYKSEAKAKVVAWASITMSRFTAGYPPEEVLSWSAKLPAARRVLAGHREVMIEIEAQALGVPVLALAAKVVEKGGIYEAIAALAAAIRGKTQAGIDAAESVDQVDLVLAAALEEAKTTLASLGVA